MTELQPSSAVQLSTELDTKIREYVQASSAWNTRRAYGASWRIFVAWCEGHDVPAIPAAPGNVAAFLVDQATHCRVSTIELRLAAIRYAHELGGHASPTKSLEVSTVMKGIRRTHLSKPTKKAALLGGDIVGVCQRLPKGLHGDRDRALLLVGFTAALRRSELVALTVEDIGFASEGMTITVRRGKTDQEGHSRVIGVGYGAQGSTCPVTAVRRWLSRSGVSQGPIFRRIDRHGSVQGRLSERAVARIVQRRGEEVGLDPKVLGGHSLRSGFATSAAAAGVGEREIARVTGHRSLVVLRGYIQAATLFDGDLTKRLGL